MSYTATFMGTSDDNNELLKEEILKLLAKLPIEVLLKIVPVQLDSNWDKGKKTHGKYSLVLDPYSQMFNVAEFYSEILTKEKPKNGFFKRILNSWI